MSVIASNWARVQILHRTPKAVLMYLAERANQKKGYFCFPGQQTIAEHVGVTDRTVRTALQYLEEMGYIHRQRRNRSNGARTSDTIHVLVSDEVLEPDPYGHWVKEKRQAYRKLLPNLPETVAGLPVTATGAIEPEGLTGSRTGSTSTQDSSKSALEDARELSLNETVLVTVSEEMTKALPHQTDEVINTWFWTSQEKLLEQDFSNEHPRVYRARMEFVHALSLEVERRFGVSSGGTK